MKKIFFTLFFGFIIIGIGQSQSLTEDTVMFDLSTPYQTIKSFNFYSQSAHFNPSLIKKCAELASNDSTDFPKKLIQLIKGEGISIKLEEISNDPNYLDSTTQLHVYKLNENYPLLYLKKINGLWIFPKESVANVLQLHEKLFAFGGDILLEIMDSSHANQYFGLTVNQYLAGLFFIFTAFVIHKLLSKFIEKTAQRIIKKLKVKKISAEEMTSLIKPFSFLIIILLLSFVFPILQLPASFSFYLATSIRAAIPLLFTITSFRLIKFIGLYLEMKAAQTKNTMDDQLVPIIRKSLRVFVVTFGTLAILQSLNISILPLLTGLSIGGLAFALAAQDTIKNFFGSVMIFIDKPFQIGHWITTDGVDGTVEEVGLRSTRIRTFSNSLVTVPNGKLADATINNHGLRVYRRFYTTLSINYDTPPALIEVFIDGLKEIVNQHPDTNPEHNNIFFNDMGAHSLNIMFYIFFEVPDWSSELKARHEILLEILKLGNALKVNFAFPTQTLHIPELPTTSSSDARYPDDLQAKENLTQFLALKKNDQ